MYYTLGQRQGLGIGGLRDAGDDPWYVVDKDLESNTLLVVQGEHPRMFSSEIEVSKTSWIGASPESIDSEQGISCSAKIRYRQSDQVCRVRKTADDRLTITFESPQRSVAPGQYAVLYDGERCLGGAVIDRVMRNDEYLRDAV
jgi:tRNA-specific 2-thiouridylase